MTLVVRIILAKFFVLFNDGFTPFGIPVAPERFGGQTGTGIPDARFGSGRGAMVRAESISGVLPLPEGYTSIQVAGFAPDEITSNTKV